MTYTIRRGDTLSSLAKKYNTSVSALQKLNGIRDANKIYAGDTLEIPDAAGAEINLSGTAARWSDPHAGSAGGASAQPAYQQSDTLRSLANAVAAKEQARPADYQSPYADRVAAVLDALENREAFAYDPGDDPLYAQYKDAYTQGGRLAMQDAMGSAAGLTGGYGSSYGQSVGQQTYQAYMQALNDKIPVLARDAYSQYQQAGETLYDQLAAYGALDERAYDKYRDSVSDYYDDLSFYAGQYNKAAAAEQSAYEAQLSAWEKAQAQAYKAAQDAQDQANWEKEYTLKLGKTGAAGAKSASSASKADSAAAEKIYALFAGMLQSERRAMVQSAKSAAYIRDVLGASGYAALKAQYGL